MQRVLESAARKFVAEQHLKNLLAGEWVEMFDADGNLLTGIRGRIGACATKVDGSDIGVDLIEMRPGSAFPLHQHDGDHILYFASGEGIVHINGTDHPVKTGDSIFIPAEYPHGVKVPASAQGVLLTLAFGHPHKHVDAKDRMKHLEEEGRKRRELADARDSDAAHRRGVDTRTDYSEFWDRVD